jgi:3-oxoacyl-[acyl-carrier-protein] synthase II
MQKAIDDAQLPGGKDDIDAIIAHGTGTPKGDIAEIRAINRLFGDREKKLKVSSIKGHVGHTAGAVGLMGVMAALHSMNQKALVPTAGTTDVDAAADFEVVTLKPSPANLETMLVNGFGFGGQNASLVVSKG